MTSVDFSADGKRVVFAVRGSDGKSRIWLAPLDRRSPPRQISSSANEFNPLFGPTGDVFFPVEEGRFKFIYRVNADGTGRQKVLSDPF
jgi:Tol biopolymer transport system component